MSTPPRPRQKSDQSRSEAKPLAEFMPTVEVIQQALSQAENLDDFFGKEGIVAQLFARTIEQMREGELSHELGYEKYDAKGSGSGNSRNGKRSRGLRTSAGEVEIEVPRDRNGDYQPQLLATSPTKTNELEEKIIAL